MWYNHDMVQYRKDQLVNGEYYHIYNRSIAKYIIFNDEQEYERMLELINVLKFVDFDYQFSHFKRLDKEKQHLIVEKMKVKNKTLVDIIAYCLMPTHLHLILKQNFDNGITKYMGKILNSYSKYFNTKHNRIGPLWSGRFKNVRIENDDQLLHLTRYIYLNPTSANLVNDPIYWLHSSYNEYLSKTKFQICNYKNVLDIDTKKYRQFVNNQKDYQKQISSIKHLLIENYSG